jgi:hypothetical protein
VKPLKLHLGAGYKRIPGFVNVDFDPLCEPDMVLDIEKPSWPIEDDSVDQVVAHHLLEHLGDPGFFVFMKELYRVCSNGALIEVVVPHHRHECFLNDPTHRRPITIEGMKLFSKSHNIWCINSGDGSSRLGMYYNVDFEIVDYQFNIDPMYHNILETIKSGSPEEQQFHIALRERNNMVVDVKFTMKVIKDDGL